MATFDYVNMRDNVATNLLEQFGDPVEIVTEGKGTLDKDSGKMVGTSSEVVQDTVGGYTEFTRFELAQGDVRRDDIKMMISAMATIGGGDPQELDITTSHKLKFDDAIHTIIAIKPIGFATTVVAYEVHIRQ